MSELIKTIRIRKMSIACGIFLLTLFVGTLASSILRTVMLTVSALLFAASFAGYIITGRRTAKYVVPGFIPFILSAMLTASLISFLYFGLYLGRVTALAGSEHTVTAEVLSVEHTTVYSTTYIIETRTVDSKKLKFKSQLETAYASEYEVRDIIEFTAEFEKFSRNIAGFDEQAYNTSKGIILLAETDEQAAVTGRSSADISDIASYLNDRLRNLLYYGIADKEAAGFASGILLGNRSDVPQTLKRDFRSLGLSHMLALSGLHLSIICGIFDRMLYALYVPKKYRLILTLFLIPIYMLFTGMSPSIVRGGLMLMIAIVTQLVGGRYDPVTALFCAVSLICLVSPTSAADIGLIMSFLATLGIITLGFRIVDSVYKVLAIKTRKGFKRSLYINAAIICESLAMTFSALLFTFPVSWLSYGEISLAGIIATPIAAPFLTLIISGSALLMLTTPIKPLARAIEWFVTVIYRFLSDMTELCAVPEMLISLSYPFTVVIIALFCVLFAVMLMRKVKIVKALFIPIGICSVLFALCVTFYNAVDSVSVNAAYVTYGKNDMIVVNSGGCGLICDISDGSARPLNEAKYILRDKLHIGRIDTLMLTHYHRRHIGSFISFARSSYVDRLLLPYPKDEADSGIAMSLTEAADEYDIEVVFYRPGETFTYRRSDITLCGDDTVGYSEHPIIALSVTASDSGLLYAGSSAYNSQAYGFCEKSAQVCESVIFGIHGPKQKFDTAASDNPNVKEVCTAESDKLPIYGFANAEQNVLERKDNVAYHTFEIE